MYKFETKKDVKKFIRSLLELLVLILILVMVIRALFVFRTYQPYDKKDPAVVSGEDHGFVAISYFGVDRSGTDTLISTERLDEHLKALYDNGYVTISQEDIEKYYKEGTPLPDKALFLMYEDGRKDTAIFAQKIMEEYNFMGTILSYGEKFETKDSKFLMPKDLKNLEDNSFWELGTNGYRMSYINVFDRYGTYLGELSTNEFAMVAKYLDREYNQYLMDFIRDENGIPKETYNQMQTRVVSEYELMNNIYTDELGELPGVYILMHSNTGRYANNEKVSALNEQCMEDLFVMNFNREGYSHNNTESSIYDLTRMQPQSYWYTNHLLMRIWDDLDEEQKDTITFVDGDLERKADWETLDGASEFKDEIIALTSMPEGVGTLRLKGSESYKDVIFTADLTGNKLGTQSVYLRSNEDMTSYVKVMIQNNWLYVKETTPEGEEFLYELDLYVHDGYEPQSVEENKKEALIEDYEALEEHAKNQGDSGKEFRDLQKEAKEIETKSVEEGAEEYRPTIQIKEAGNRALEIRIKDDKLTVIIDGKTAAEDIPVSVTEAGFLCLESAWSEYGFSQRNISDDVYDGVFERVTVKSNNEKPQVLYENKLTGTQKMGKQVGDFFDGVIDWFIETI